MTSESDMSPFRVVIIGGGRIGSALALMLCRLSDFKVTLVDPTEPARERARILKLPLVEFDPSDKTKLDRLLRESDAVVAALPAAACPMIAAAAKRACIHYLDLNEDSASAAEIVALARDATRSFVPQCGISPGLISTVTLDLMSKVTSPNDIQIRVGILPRHSTNRLGYGLTWDVNALIAEYTNPSTALLDGRPVKLPPLSDLEILRIDGCTYEAFVSGSVPVSLCQRLEGRVETVVSKTIRYPGHLEHIRFLLDDLRLRRRPDLLRNLLLNALPEIDDDQLLIFVSARGVRDGRGTEINWLRRILPDSREGCSISAIRRTAASHVAAILDLLRKGELPKAGLIAQEDIPLANLRDNRFLSWFFAEDATAS
jgi:saccharopine dehydrogenase-like NADP-dependent oxidoreductase